jgi:PBP1b-binding outer membrane lipoprotein LpoB
VKKLYLSAALLIAALALAGCTTTANEALEATSAPPVAIASVAPATPTPTKTPDPAQAWADGMIENYLAANGAASFKGFFEGSPDREIKSWDSPRAGTLSVTVGGSNWKRDDLEGLSLRIVNALQWHSKELDSVEVSTGGNGSAIRCFPNHKRGNQATKCA